MEYQISNKQNRYTQALNSYKMLQCSSPEADKQDNYFTAERERLFSPDRKSAAFVSLQMIHQGQGMGPEWRRGWKRKTGGDMERMCF